MRAVSPSASVAILCGGQSRRIGEDKGLKPFLGRPLIERVVERLSPAQAFAENPRVCLITNRPDDYAFLGLPMVRDQMPGLGPLGGLLTALTHCQTPALALVACDMPFVNPALLAHAAGLLDVEDKSFYAAVPLSQKGYEPLHAVYRVAACLPVVQVAVAARDLALHALLSRLNVRAITPAECAPFGPRHLAFTNVNTPEEWLLAEQTARETQG